jgi:hypothetical protein
VILLHSIAHFGAAPEDDESEDLMIEVDGGPPLRFGESAA